FKDEDGKDGEAEFAGGQTTFGFGSPGISGGDGGYTEKTEFSGKSVKFMIIDKLGDITQHIKFEVEQNRGCTG
ncbi:unnamed protein product, partial [Didymodactylos carnosus]